MTALPVIISGDDFVAQTLAMVRPPFHSRYGMLTWSDLDRPGAELEWLVDDLLTVGDKSIIGGPSQSGKSFLAIEAGMCIALGKPFLGHPVRTGLVIYQAGEGARGIKNRLRAYRKHFGIPSDAHVPFVLLQHRVDLFSEEGDTKGLIEEVQAIRAMYDEPLQIIVIDTLAKAQGFADENSGKDMARVLDNIDRIREATGVAICLVHHLNADGTKLRGHTSVFANIDQVLSVTCDKETKVRTAKTAKMKDGADDVTVRFKLKSVILGEDARGKEITSCVVLPVGDTDAAPKEEERAFKPNASEKEFMHALFKVLEEKGQSAPPGMDAVPFGRKVVAMADIRQVHASSSIKADEDERKAQNRIRQAFKRAGDWLRNAKVIGVQDDLVWWTGRVVHGVPETYPERRPERPRSATQGGDDDDNLPF